jgi:hypothetical protein
MCDHEASSSHWKHRQLDKEKKLADQACSASVEASLDKDSFSPSKSFPAVDEEDLIIESKRDSQIEEPAGEGFVSDEALKKSIEKLLKEEIGSSLPPVYVQVRNILGTLAGGTALPESLPHYVTELIEYIAKQKAIFEALKTGGNANLETLRRSMLDGLALISGAVDSLDRITGDENALAGADELLGQAIELFYAARDALGAGVETR